MRINEARFYEKAHGEQDGARPLWMVDELFGSNVRVEIVVDEMLVKLFIDVKFTADGGAS